MSGNLMTIEEAAAHLAVSERTIRTYIKEGWLSTHKKAGSRRKWFEPLEVEELRLDKQKIRTSKRSMRQDLMHLKAQVRRLRAEMDAVAAILDTQSKPLQFKPKDAAAVYKACVGQLRAQEWSLDQIQPWIPVFMRLQEEDFQMIREETDDTRPWVPFLRLCMKMSAFLAGHSGYTTNLDMQSAHRQLAEGRRRLRVAALCYADLHAYNMDDAIRRARLADTPSSVRDLLGHAIGGK